MRFLSVLFVQHNTFFFEVSVFLIYYQYYKETSYSRIILDLYPNHELYASNNFHTLNMSQRVAFDPSVITPHCMI